LKYGNLAYLFLINKKNNKPAHLCKFSLFDVISELYIGVDVVAMFSCVP
jgi:hypothetical protein